MLSFKGKKDNSLSTSLLLSRVERYLYLLRLFALPNVTSAYSLVYMVESFLEKPERNLLYVDPTYREHPSVGDIFSMRNQGTIKQIKSVREKNDLGEMKM